MHGTPRSRFLVSSLLAGSLASLLIVATPRALAQESTAPAAEAASTAAAAPAETPKKLHEVIAASDPQVQAFNEHLTVLASPWMEGRLPGTRGMERAMDYMEHYFVQAGLEPAYQPSDGGPKSYRQPFSLGGRREVVEETITLKCGGTETALAKDTDFKLTGLGRSGAAEGALAFVGYGLDDGPDGYSSFAEGHSLEGKIAVLLRFEPMDDQGNSRWSGGEGWSGRAGFQGKISAVARRNPAAIIVVNTPGANDPRISSLNAGGGRAMAEVPVFMMSTAAGEKLIAACDGGKRSLMDLRKLADEPKEGQPMSFDLEGSTVAVAGRSEEKPVKAENVVGVLPGRGALASEVIVIGGHLDHLGNGDFGSREGPGKLHPGADDNASGSAGVILLGESLKKAYDALPAETPLRTILFIGFSAEESGLNGSRHYVDNPIYPIKDTVLMMNFDMIGRILNDRLAVTSSAAAKGMTEWAKPMFDASGLVVVHNASRGGGGGGSDHASFMAVGVPILFAIIADFHGDYHTSRDVVGLIDRESSVKAIRLWHELALDMAKREKRFEMEDAAGGPMRAQPMRVRAGLRTRDSDDESGIEVVDVTKDGSADKAGILKGDKIIKWNKKDLRNRQEFVEDLRTQEPGAKVQAVVLRNGEEVTIYIELQGPREQQ
ncbi:MAG: M28 family peptidase [Planctomycetaceae bacterium]|nr:M28 family peptidase [Planctomycetaceae bacterium]